MDKQELRLEMAMNYNDLTKHLQNKYGKPNRAYFRTTTCRTKSPITRGNEGLFIHHIKETEVDDLSKPEQAVLFSWEYQEPHNLCYCNYLEHLLLHVLISEKRCKEVETFVIDGLLNHLIPIINENYNKNDLYATDWRNAAKEVIINNKEEYREILSLWLEKISLYNVFNLTVDKLLLWEGLSGPRKDYVAMRVALQRL